MPNELDALENDVRAVIKSGVARGHLQIHCGITRTAASGSAPLNRPLLNAYMSAFREASEMFPVSGGPDLNSALRIPGMLATATRKSPAKRWLRRFRRRRWKPSRRSPRPRARGAATAERCDSGAGILRPGRSHGRDPAAPSECFRNACAKTGRPSPRRRHRAPASRQEAAISPTRSDISEELMRLRTHATTEQMLKARGSRQTPDSCFGNEPRIQHRPSRPAVWRPGPDHYRSGVSASRKSTRSVSRA
jgi:hypothetical protein